MDFETSPMKTKFNHNARSYAIDLQTTGKQHLVGLQGETRAVELVRAENGWMDLRFTASDCIVRAYISSNGPKRWVTVGGQTFVLAQSAITTSPRGSTRHSAGDLPAPMPGQVRSVQATEGDTVTAGQTLLVLEAMKMEIKIAAPFDGQVKLLKVAVGDVVEKEQLLAIVTSET